MTSKVLARIKKLKFLAPHGASGIISLVTGAVISFSSIIGNYSLLQSFGIMWFWVQFDTFFWSQKSNFIYVYIISSAINVIAAYTILSGDRLTKFGFKVGIIMMISLDYLAFRFRYETKVSFVLALDRKNFTSKGQNGHLEYLMSVQPLVRFRRFSPAGIFHTYYGFRHQKMPPEFWH